MWAKSVKCLCGGDKGIAVARSRMKIRLTWCSRLRGSLRWRWHESRLGLSTGTSAGRLGEFCIRREDSTLTLRYVVSNPNEASVASSPMSSNSVVLYVAFHVAV